MTAIEAFETSSALSIEAMRRVAQEVDTLIEPVESRSTNE